MSTPARVDPNPTTPTARWELVAVAAVVAVGLALRLLAFTRPAGEIDFAFVPDDTYYTLAIARSLAHGHGPGASAGIATSGFQPLLAFLMVPVYRVTDNLDLAFRVDVLLMIVADLVSIVLLYRLGRRIAGPVAGVIAGLVWACSPIALRNAMGGLEGSLAVVLALAFLLAWLRTGDTAAPPARFVVLGVTAGLLVLARVDAALLVAVVVVVEVLIGRGRRLLPAALGAAVVALPWFAYAAVRFGTPIPTSGMAASRLAPLPRLGTMVTALTTNAFAGGPFTIDRDFRTWFTDNDVVGAVLFWVAVAGFLTFGVATFVRRRRPRRAPVPDDALSALAVFSGCLIGFYGWFGVYWYDVRYLLPVAACLTLLVVTAGVRLWRRPRARLVVVPVGIALLAVGVTGSVAEATRKGPEHALHAFATGFGSTRRAILERLPRGSRVAAYQSGALSYFGADRFAVINLDGVVNPDAPSPHRPRATARYVAEECVGWLADNYLFVAAVVVKVNEDGDLGLWTRPVQGARESDVVLARLTPRDQPSEQHRHPTPVPHHHCRTR
jgi:hypothetical protein